MAKEATGVVSPTGKVIAWIGAIVSLIGRSTEYWLIFSIVGIGISILGCAIWAQNKNRHWVFAIWGLFAPIGFLGIALLKDKTRIKVEKNG